MPVENTVMIVYDIRQKQDASCLHAAAWKRGKMQKSRGISGSNLKIIAAVSMLIDHTAAVLLPYLLVQYGIYTTGDISLTYMGELLETGAAGRIYLLYQIMRRIIGRLAFPIYCFLLVEGFEKTRSRGKYAGRLFLFALVSEVPFNLAFCGRVLDVSYQNIFFTLFLGLVMIWGMEEAEKHCALPILRAAGYGLAFLAAAGGAELIHCDYGAKGIIAIALLFLFRKNRREQITAGCAAFLWEITAPLAFIFVGFYNGKRGMRLKYFFYAFYPVHLLILYFLTFLFRS